MKIKYDADADILFIIISETAPVNAVEEKGGIILSYGEDGNPVSIEFLNASLKKLVSKGEVNLSFPAVYPVK